MWLHRNGHARDPTYLIDCALGFAVVCFVQWYYYYQVDSYDKFTSAPGVALLAVLTIHWRFKIVPVPVK